jgi:oligosaccharide reducing-end xylanase
MFTPAPENIVRFDPGCDYTDPSYFLPAFYDTWAKKTNYTPARWADAATATRDVLVASANPSTGLAPHTSSFSGGGCASQGHRCDPQFEDDAWRVARNWALDYHWFAADPRQVELSNTILAFFADPERGGGIGKYGDV